MTTILRQDQFQKLAQSKLKEHELNWVIQRKNIISSSETCHKFSVFFSLVSRFIENDVPKWEVFEIEKMESIYPGFSKTIWTKQDLVRVTLMISLDASINRHLLKSFFEIAEMNELIALYKGLFFLENAKEFSSQVEEGIRTNMVNVFDAIAAGNPYAKTYLKEDAWNQLILKALFLDRPLYTIQYIDQGKNKNLAEMLQDYTKERWSAQRTVSPELWRMVDGYLREDIKEILVVRSFEGKEKVVMDNLFQHKEHVNSSLFWDEIGIRI